MFMQIAIGAIGIGIVLMVGYLIIAQVNNALPTPQIANPCLGENASAAGECFGLDNSTAIIDDASFLSGVSGTQATVFAGFGLVAVGIIVLSAFGLINVFR